MNHHLLARWADVERILDDVLGGPESDRLPRAQALCAGDPDLAGLVQQLLAAADGAPATAAAIVEEALRDADAGAELPAFVGPFRVLDELGRGGMGRVLLAMRDGSEASPRVAIKLLDRPVAASDARRRFERERETLARLEHPNIARLHDGGVTADGMPYLVMEYVEGLPIDQYCDRHALDVE